MLAVKVAQNAAASELDAVYAEAQAWLAGLLHPKTRGRKGSKSALRILEVEMVGQKRMNEQKKKKNREENVRVANLRTKERNRTIFYSTCE